MASAGLAAEGNALLVPLAVVGWIHAFPFLYWKGTFDNCFLGSNFSIICLMQL